MDNIEMKSIDGTALIAQPSKRSPSWMAFATLQLVSVLALGVQCAIDSSATNLAAALLAAFSSIATLQYLQLTRAFQSLPLSSFAVLGLCMTTQWGALVAQAAHMTPVSDGLRVPVRTFALLAGFQCIAVLAHWLYRSTVGFAAMRGALVSTIYRPLGLFLIPRPGNLWLMGTVGLTAQFLVGDFSSAESMGVARKVLQAVTFLAWAPFLVPIFRSTYGPTYCNARRQYSLVGAYVLLAIAVGLALNIRAILFAGVATAGLLLFMRMLSDEEPLSRSYLARASSLTILGLLGVSYAADLATAMAVARAQRGQASALTLVEETMYTLMDRSVIERYRDAEIEASKSQVYDEFYIPNPVVTRMVETKFHDNMFFLTEDLSPTQIAILADETGQRLREILPRPVLGMLGVETDDKKSGELASLGDFMVYLKYGTELGGFKTGSLFAHGLALFPATFPFIYLALCLVLYLLWDSLSTKEWGRLAVLSPVAMLVVWRLFMQGLTTESIPLTVTFILRSFWQNILVYLLVFQTSRLLFRAFDPPNSSTVSAQ